jgi:hypothetical protein
MTPPVSGAYAYERSADRPHTVNIGKCSVKVFQWVPKASGGLKKGPRLHVIRGRTEDIHQMYTKAEAWIRENYPRG